MDILHDEPTSRRLHAMIMENYSELTHHLHFVCNPMLPVLGNIKPEDLHAVSDKISVLLLVLYVFFACTVCVYYDQVQCKIPCIVCLSATNEPLQSASTCTVSIQCIMQEYNIMLSITIMHSTLLCCKLMHINTSSHARPNETFRFTVVSDCLQSEHNKQSFSSMLQLVSIVQGRIATCQLNESSISPCELRQLLNRCTINSTQ